MRFLPSGRQFLSEMRMTKMPAVMQLQRAVAVIVTVIVIVITIITASARACRQLVAQCFPILALCSTRVGILPPPPPSPPSVPRTPGCTGARNLDDISTNDFYPIRAAGPESPKCCHGQPSCLHPVPLQQGLTCISGAFSHPGGCPGDKEALVPLSMRRACAPRHMCVGAGLCGCSLPRCQ